MSLTPQVSSLPIWRQGTEGVWITLQLSRKQGKWFLFQQEGSESQTPHWWGKDGTLPSPVCHEKVVEDVRSTEKPAWVGRIGGNSHSPIGNRKVTAIILVQPHHSLRRSQHHPMLRMRLREDFHQGENSACPLRIQRVSLYRRGNQYALAGSQTSF